MSSQFVFTSKNKRSGFLGSLDLDLEFDLETSKKIFEIAGVVILAKFSTKGVTIKEVQLILDSQIGRDIALYVKDNFVDSRRPEVFSEKLSLAIPLFEDQMMQFIELLRKKFD